MENRAGIQVGVTGKTRKNYALGIISTILGGLVIIGAIYVFVYYSNAPPGFNCYWYYDLMLISVFPFPGSIITGILGIFGKKSKKIALVGLVVAIVALFMLIAVALYFLPRVPMCGL
nr:hypothetical protein [Candidatus Sigynarchaeota archaeon]